MGIDWQAFALSLRLATVTTVLLLLLGTPLAYWLAHARSRLVPLVDAVTALPLVLPPTVLGFYLLVLLGPEGALGGPWEALGGPRLVFSFPGLVVGSFVFSLPFVVGPLRDAFAAVGRAPLEVAATLRAPPLDRFFSVTVPLALPGFLTAATLGFAHTLGEFGVVLMLGGSIPGRTRVASVAIFEHVERLQYGAAHRLSALLLLACLLLLLLVRRFGRGRALP